MSSANRFQMLGMMIVGMVLGASVGRVQAQTTPGPTYPPDNSVGVTTIKDGGLASYNLAAPTGSAVASCGPYCDISVNAEGQVIAIADAGAGQSLACPAGQTWVGIDGGASACAFPYTLNGGYITIDSLDGGAIVVETTGNTTVYTDGGNIELMDLATGDYAVVSASSGIILSDTAGKGIIETTAATLTLTASGGASGINLLSVGDAGVSITAQHGPFTVAAAGECSFACSSYSWPVQVQIDFSAYNAANLGSATAFSRTVFANASTLTSASNIAIDSAGVGTGPVVVKLCSDGTTCGAGNVYLTCTPSGADCTAAAGTITACTVTKSAVSAATTLTWSVQTACGTTDPGFNVVAHATTP